MKNLALLMVTSLLAAGCATAPRKTAEEIVYIGTYTGGDSEGIYTYKLNLKTGELTHLATTGGIENPSFLALHPKGLYLYAVSQIRSNSGSIYAYKREAGGKLTLINKQSSEGAGPAHLLVDHSGRWLLTANYTGGTVALLPINEDGSLGPATDVKQHTGSSVNPDRQKEPHPHSIWVSPDNRFVFVPDLGIDKVVIYKLDHKEGKLLPNDPADYQSEPGAGPRHFTFHHSGRYAFVINELSSTITSLSYDQTNGVLSRIETVSTLPDTFSGTNTCADIHTTPDGRFVYGSNRGHDSIAAFSFDRETGQLTFVETESTQGVQPRNFAIDPTGKILLAANQRTNNVVTFWIDQKTGELSPTGHSVTVPTPVCLKPVL